MGVSDLRIVVKPRNLGAVALAVVMHSCGGSAPTEPSGTVPGPTQVGLACGTERWAVKTLSDPEATRVNPDDAVTTTINALNGFPAHCSGAPDRRTFDEEFRVFEVVGRVTYVGIEGDHDFHAAVADPAAPNRTMVIEIADPACSGAASSPHAETLAAARSAMNALAGADPARLVGQTIRARGVGFFDTNHDQIGRSSNCIELHPVLRIERVSTSQ